MNPRRVSLVLILAVAAGGYVLYSQKGGDELTVAPAPGPTPAVTPPAPAGALPESAPLTLPPPETVPAKAVGYIAYPDGTFYPPLNGVKVAPKMFFHPRMAPFSKVTGRIRDGRGREWYVHENGVRSTTYVNSAGVETYEIEKDVPAQPTLPEETPGIRK